MDRRERKKRQTRAAIQAAAVDLFAAHGYRETTIGAIAEAADVAVRTVTGHFPTKEALLFADDPFAPESLAQRLDGRGPGALALDVMRDWMADTMRDLDGEPGDAFWRRRALRARLILSDPVLRGHARGASAELEAVLAGGVAHDLGVHADALAPRLVALSVVVGLRELYVADEAGAGAAGPTVDGLLALVDEVIAFARAGAAVLARQPPA